MRHIVLGLCVLTASTSAYAQNYLPARDYSGPTTIVNMDVLQTGGFGHSSFAPPPILSMPLPPPEAAPAPLYAHVPSPMPLPVAPPSSDRHAPMPIVPQGTVNAIHTSDLGDLPPADMVEPPARKSSIAAVQELPPPPVNAVSSTAPIKTIAIQPTDHLLPPAQPIVKEVPSYKVASLNNTPSVPSPVMPHDKNASVHSGIANDTVATPKAATEDDFEAYRLLFDAGSSELKPSEKEVLNKVITKMKNDPNIRLRMQAYAAGTPETTGQARRLSLARAMKIRTYMTENGVVATRLDVRALGMGSTSMNDTVARSKAPADRVDVIFMRG